MNIFQIETQVMTSKCPACQQSMLNNDSKKHCRSCDKDFCSNCLYQRVAIPKLNYQMHEVCTPCFHAITSQMMLQKPPKGFLQRLEQQQPQQSKRIPAEELDPETKALEERLAKLRQDFPAQKSQATKNYHTPDDLIQQMNEDLAIQASSDRDLADRLRVLHETMPAATPDTVVLAKKPEEKEENADDDELPWCTVCNDNATKRCLDCDELFCESCVKKIHRQSGYKNHQFESYRASAKLKKKYY